MITIYLFELNICYTYEMHCVLHHTESCSLKTKYATGVYIVIPDGALTP